MRKQNSPAAFGFDSYDKRRLQRALKEVADKRSFLRLKAVLLFAEGMNVQSVAKLFDKSVQIIYRWIRLYLKNHSPGDLLDAARSGRPGCAKEITDKRILQELKRNPLHLGYNTTVWSVALLAEHLHSRYKSAISVRTLRRRMKAAGLRFKRPRYVYSEKDPHRAQKKAAIVRKLKHMPASAVVLFEDEMMLRLFPVLRRAWALKGEQASIGITGRNARRVLFGTINLRTGYRILMQYPKMNQEGFQTFLRLLHRRYRGRRIWLQLDAGSAHTAPRTQSLARSLHIQLIWLPKQCPELNAMDHLWKELKADISANYQYETIEQHAVFAVDYTLKLPNRQVLKRAGMLSKNFWLQSFLK